MKKFILLGLLASAAIASAVPASAQDWRWRGRDRVIVQERSGIDTSTLAIILALQAAQRAAEAEKDTVVVRERAPAREYVPLK